jgi:CheY-like chemotaxis protein
VAWFQLPSAGGVLPTLARLNKWDGRGGASDHGSRPSGDGRAEPVVRRAGDGQLSGADAERIRCLIVDDNPGFVEVAHRLLEHDGITVIGAATDSEQAFRLVAELLPDVALIDLILGEDNGAELIADIARAGLASQMIMILCSTYAEEDLADIAPDAAAAYLPKTDLSGGAIRGIVQAGDREPPEQSEADPQ